MFCKSSLSAGRSVRAVVALSALLFIAACGGKGDGEDPAPDVSNVQVDLQTIRFDRELSAIDTNNIPAGLAALDRKYPQFTAFYIDTMMGYGVNRRYEPRNPGIDSGVHSMLTYPDFRQLFDTVARHFPDTKEMDAQLKKGFQHLKHYYPGAPVPKMYYIVSLLNNMSGFNGDSLTGGVALDMYLGPDYPNYTAAGHPEYRIRTFRPEYAPVNYFAAWWRNQQPFEEEGSNLLDMMLQRGREQFFLSRILPFVPDSVRFGFTAPQMQWVKENEAMIYATICQPQSDSREPLLYERAWNKVRPFVNEGPLLPGMPQECPANVGAYIGYRIVRAWAAKHAEMPLPQQLAPPPDPQKFLEQAAYKP